MYGTPFRMDSLVEKHVTISLLVKSQIEYNRHWLTERSKGKVLLKFWQTGMY